MDKKEPSVSVLMTAYKGNEHFLPAVRSILAQTYPDLELVIVLDPSEKDLCKEQVIKLDDPRIRLIENRKREGLVRSRNIGLRACRGGFIAIMDSDDVSRPERIEMEVEFLEKNPDHVLVGSPCDIIDDEGAVIKEGEAARSDEQLYYDLLFANQFPHSSVMLRKEVLEKVGEYDEELQYGEDYDLYLRTMEHGRVHMLEYTLVSWRRYGSSVTSTVSEDDRGKMLGIIKRNIKRKLGIDVPPEILMLYIDHSIKGRSLRSIMSSLSLLREINSSFMDRGGGWMDKVEAKKVARRKFLSLLTGQVVSNRGLLSIKLLILNIRYWPGLLFHILGRL
ncbi:MAG: glycosyltransferase [Thermoplasmatota archaeon]